MDSYHLLSILVRRWFIVVPVGLLAFLAGSRVVSDVDPVYRAQGAAVLTLLETSPDPGQPARNPMLDFIGSLRTAGITISAVATSSDAKAQIAEQGLSTNYTVSLPQEGPILEVTAEAGRPTVAVRTATAVLDLLAVELGRLQDDLGAPANLRARVTVLNTPTRASEITTDKLRAMIAAAAIGIAGTIALAVLVDSWVEGRRSRRLVARATDGHRRRWRRERDGGPSAEPVDEPSTADRAPHAHV